MLKKKCSEVVVEKGREIQGGIEKENVTEVGNVIGAENVKEVGDPEADLRRGRRRHLLRKRNIPGAKAEVLSDIDIETRNHHSKYS